jgi:hypothetical protein
MLASYCRLLLPPPLSAVPWAAGLLLAAAQPMMASSAAPGARNSVRGVTTVKPFDAVMGSGGVVVGVGVV